MNFKNIPPVTLNLLIINCVVLLLQDVLMRMGIDLNATFGLNFFLADNFRIWQLFTYMFMHGGLMHLFFNMFALWMFGMVIERTLGTKRFLIYYLFCGVGAGICQELWQFGEFYFTGMMAYDNVNLSGTIIPMEMFLNQWITVGASGACYGVLLAFGVLYPEQRIMLLIPPIPMKAKYFVIAYAAIELFSAFSSNGNIAHFAHLGGMLFGWLLLRYWRRQQKRSQYRNRIYINGEKPTILQRIRNVFDYERRKKTAPQAPKTSHSADHEYNLRRKQEEERLDAILDKVRQSGYDSLTAQEKQELFRISR